MPWCPSSKWDRPPPQSNPLTFAPLQPPSPGNSTMRLRSFHLRSVSPPLAYHCDESDSRPPMRQFPVPWPQNSRGSCRKPPPPQGRADAFAVLGSRPHCRVRGAQHPSCPATLWPWQGLTLDRGTPSRHLRGGAPSVSCALSCPSLNSS